MPAEQLIKEETYTAVGYKDDNGRFHLIFQNKQNPDVQPLTDEEIEEIKSNLKDWGKWIKFKELKKDLRD
ncbi:Uncharacterised protein [uncultured archaeon]|nr:Uncharacterised protein [uncultured archaeon]